MKRQLLLTIAALAVLGCTSGTPVSFNENESRDKAGIETHLPGAQVEKRAVSSCKYLIMSFHLVLTCYF